jgi:hypothetical protein
MIIDNLILISTLAQHYKVEITFFFDLNELGLIEITTIEKSQYIHQKQMVEIEKMIRMYNELEVNIPGIDVAFNLLQKINSLQKELISTKNRLRLYEN